MQLDYRTIFVMACLILVAYCLFPVFIFGGKGPAPRYLRLWSLSFPSLLAGSLFMVLRGVIPPTVSILGSNLALLLGNAFILAGLRTYAGRSQRWHFPILVIGGVLLADLWLTLVSPSTEGRVIVFALVSCVYFALAARVALSLSTMVLGVVPAVTAGFLFLLALLNAARVVLALLFGVPEDLLSAKGWDSMIQLLTTSGVAGLGLAFLALHASRLNGELAASVRDRELLYREMAHRTKNDLALVDSLIALEMDEVADKGLGARLEALRERLRCIAAAHDNLARTEDPGRLRLDVYLDVLRKALDTGGRARFVCEFESVEVPSVLALPLGLAMNELVTNSLKHAYPGKSGGLVEISLKKKAGGFVELRVRDEGPGTIWPPSKEGLGSLILEGMVKKLRGRLTLEPGPGASWLLEFPAGAGS